MKVTILLYFMFEVLKFATATELQDYTSNISPGSGKVLGYIVVLLKENYIVIFLLGWCKENSTCAIQDDNLIDSIAKVYTIEECKNICEEVDACQYITYFGSTSFPFVDYCMIFSECPMTNECQDCISESRVCFETCSDSFESTLTDNAISILPNTEDEPRAESSLIDFVKTNFGK